ncbi:toprim domain-containing protein [Candidatus Woesearchaeota archaeon]|nr:toprim domain-containing protein [Candidatus Woesearchaeota archaeon]
MNQINNEFSEHIDKIKQSNQLIIVEGKKDRKALENFGIKNIIELNKKPLFEIIESISHNNEKCIILTDLDKQGKELYGKLNSGLQQRGVKIDNSFRNFLFKNTKLRQIEGMETYAANNINTKLINEYTFPK